MYSMELACILIILLGVNILHARFMYSLLKINCIYFPTESVTGPSKPAVWILKGSSPPGHTSDFIND